jgi:hypothetical protein
VCVCVCVCVCVHMHGLDGSASGEGQVVGSCESCNVLLGSLKCGEFLD